jgi:hypothetical protein
MIQCDTTQRTKTHERGIVTPSAGTAPRGSKYQQKWGEYIYIQTFPFIMGRIYVYIGTFPFKDPFEHIDVLAFQPIGLLLPRNI